MSEDTAAIAYKHKQFIERVAASKLVWGLKNKNGWANTSASDDEDTSVIPFWSDKAYSKACARDDWRGYLPSPITLADFLETWCMEMAEENVLAGTDWDANMVGMENGALDLALEILNCLDAIGSVIVFKNYGSVDDFIAKINGLIEQL